MNYKQKLGDMALGAGVLAMGIIIGQWVTSDIEAQSDGIFDEVVCKGLTIVDKANRPWIMLYYDEVKERANIAIFDKKENLAAFLTGTEHGSVFDLNFLSGESGVA